MSPPGAPLAQTVALPGTPVSEDGYLVPRVRSADETGRAGLNARVALGFGIDIDDDWLEKVTV